jgi:hypothetical protein
MKQLAEGTVSAVKDFVGRSLAPLKEHITLLARQRESADQLLADLEERVSKLERERLRASE